MRPAHATETTIGVKKSTLKQNFAGVVFCGHPIWNGVLTSQQQCPSDHALGALCAIGQSMGHMLGS